MAGCDEPVEAVCDEPVEAVSVDMGAYTPNSIPAVYVLAAGIEFTVATTAFT